MTAGAADIATSLPAFALGALLAVYVPGRALLGLLGLRALPGRVPGGLRTGVATRRTASSTARSPGSPAAGRRARGHRATAAADHRLSHAGVRPVQRVVRLARAALSAPACVPGLLGGVGSRSARTGTRAGLAGAVPSERRLSDRRTPVRHRRCRARRRGHAAAAPVREPALRGLPGGAGPRPGLGTATRTAPRRLPSVTRASENAGGFSLTRAERVG